MYRLAFLKTARVGPVLSQLCILHSCSKYVMRKEEKLKEKKEDDNRKIFLKRKKWKR